MKSLPEVTRVYQATKGSEIACNCNICTLDSIVLNILNIIYISCVHMKFRYMYILWERIVCVVANVHGSYESCN